MHRRSRVAEVGADPVDVLAGVQVAVAPARSSRAVRPVRHRHPHVVGGADLLPGELRPVVEVEDLGHDGREHDGAQGHGRVGGAEPVRQVDQALVAQAELGRRRLDVDADPIDAEVGGRREVRLVDGRIGERGEIPADDAHAPLAGLVDDGLQQVTIEDRIGQFGLRRLDVQRRDAVVRHSIDSGECEAGNRAGLLRGDERRRPVVHVDPCAGAPHHRGARLGTDAPLRFRSGLPVGGVDEAEVVAERHRLHPLAVAALQDVSGVTRPPVAGALATDLGELASRCDECDERHDGDGRRTTGPDRTTAVLRKNHPPRLGQAGNRSPAGQRSVGLGSVP